MVGLRSALVLCLLVVGLVFVSTRAECTDYWSGGEGFHSSFCGQFRVNQTRPDWGTTIGCTGDCGSHGDRLHVTIHRSGGPAIREVFLWVSPVGTSDWLIPAGVGYIESGDVAPDSTAFMNHHPSGVPWMGRYYFDSQPLDVGVTSTTLVLHFHSGDWLPEELNMRVWYIADDGCLMTSEFGPLEPLHGVTVSESTWGSIKAKYVP